MRMQEKLEIQAQAETHLREESHEHSFEPGIDSSSSPSPQEGQFQVYRELSDHPVSQMDPWLEMQANLETLSDLQQRLSFTLREIRYLLKV